MKRLELRDTHHVCRRELDASRRVVELAAVARAGLLRLGQRSLAERRDAAKRGQRRTVRGDVELRAISEAYAAELASEER